MGLSYCRMDQLEFSQVEMEWVTQTTSSGLDPMRFIVLSTLILHQVPPVPLAPQVRSPLQALPPLVLVWHQSAEIVNVEEMKVATMETTYQETGAPLLASSKLVIHVVAVVVHPRTRAVVAQLATTALEVSRPFVQQERGLP